MHSEFEMSMMGELDFFLGLQIKQLKEGTFIDQAKYIRDLLKRFNMEEAKTMKTPMSSSIKFDKDEKCKSINSTMYRSMIGSLLYLTASRPDIMYSGKRPAETSQPNQTEARRKARYDMTLFSSIEEYQRYKQKFTKRKVVPEKSINFSQLQYLGFEGLFGRMGWLLVVTIFESIFPTLVHAFYSQGMGKPSAHSLTMTNRVLYHMIYSIILPRGGHRDEVSYLKAFIVDSIMTGRHIHVGYLMMMHMISCCESTTQLLPYHYFLTRVFKNVRVDLSRETDFEAPIIYDTYDEQSLGRIKFEKTLDGSWIRRAKRTPAQARGQRQMHPGVEEEVEIIEMEISSIGTGMEDFFVVSDTRFYSMEDCIDQYQTGFTSQFEHFQQRFERIEERMDQQQATCEHL
ncbi:Retrovirus-related Pol polyprotein from transposon RE1 [Vitis vinifera]|uniref:Retrovirus-related Pol polyprotein from transposon RE1 n=1 Tax=Vitis vinifera TaxID=29760 RepID=A0A438H2Y7_VITVI|nr:Retrovirus-related Pol polyprotein from transposon RE1 [Vitis vinifera]